MRPMAFSPSWPCQQRSEGYFDNRTGLLQVEQPEGLCGHGQFKQLSARGVEDRAPRCLEQETATASGREPQQQRVRRCRRCCMHALPSLSAPPAQVAGLRPGRRGISDDLIENSHVERSPATWYSASVIGCLANSWPRGVPSTAAAVALSSGSRASASINAAGDGYSRVVPTVL